MKKKDSLIVNKSQISNHNPLFPSSDVKIFQDYLLDYYPDLSPKHVEYIQKSFEKYFEELIKLNVDKNNLEKISQNKNLIKANFIGKIMVRLSTDKIIPLLKKSDNADEYIRMRLEAYINDFLFFAEIGFDVFSGNYKALMSKLRRRKRSKRTNEECKEIIHLLLEGWSKYISIQMTATKFKDTDEKVKSKFNNFCKVNEINWKLKNELKNALIILGTD